MQGLLYPNIRGLKERLIRIPLNFQISSASTFPRMAPRWARTTIAVHNPSLPAAAGRSFDSRKNILDIGLKANVQRIALFSGDACADSCGNPRDKALQDTTLPNNGPAQGKSCAATLYNGQFRLMVLTPNEPYGKKGAHG